MMEELRIAQALRYRQLIAEEEQERARTSAASLFCSSFPAARRQQRTVVEQQEETRASRGILSVASIAPFSQQDTITRRNHVQERIRREGWIAGVPQQRHEGLLLVAGPTTAADILSLLNRNRQDTTITRRNHVQESRREGWIAGVSQQSHEGLLLDPTTAPTGILSSLLNRNRDSFTPKGERPLFLNNNNNNILREEEHDYESESRRSASAGLKTRGEKLLPSLAPQQGNIREEHVYEDESKKQSASAGLKTRGETFLSRKRRKEEQPSLAHHATKKNIREEHVYEDESKRSASAGLKTRGETLPSRRRRKEEQPSLAHHAKKNIHKRVKFTTSTIGEEEESTDIVAVDDANVNTISVGAKDRAAVERDKNPLSQESPESLQKTMIETLQDIIKVRQNTMDKMRDVYDVSKIQDAFPNLVVGSHIARRSVRSRILHDFVLHLILDEQQLTGIDSIPQEDQTRPNNSPRIETADLLNMIEGDIGEEMNKLRTARVESCHDEADVQKERTDSGMDRSIERERSEWENGIVRRCVDKAINGQLNNVYSSEEEDIDEEAGKEMVSHPVSKSKAQSLREKVSNCAYKCERKQQQSKFEQISYMSYEKLKEQCIELGIPDMGDKNQLISRLASRLAKIEKT